ncbi:hypothetical protein L873DRAFT_1806170 [Choiromyces venosus 120613-1]|uniref:Acyl-coenzyme A diphosphatase SCS3 n=1 Tax=Choiromyces venosus 120613-1 TaxID=1336337 RepID=A0A3N4JNC3_9PEZI|nr:hypothetical protein L873DRAFT_1806170 [Choiromyces venosus 120613-1]
MASPKPSTYETEKLDDDVPQPPSLSPTSPSPSLVLSPTDILIASIYPLTLIAGSAFSVFSPSPASTNSYFSQKRNIFNVFFVKYGWLWTTFVFLIHTSRLRSSSRPRALLRYAVATLWWISVTQWFFGPPIMDRTFLVTGGTCQLINTDPMLAKKEMGTAQMVFTSAACKVAGGKWSGGHDLSGHVFLLTHASLFLWSELLPILSLSGVAGWESVGVLALLGLWWWMLLMTGVYFHTWREKITGWIVAIVQWVVLYAWGLRSHPTIRSTFGAPGI